MKNKWGGSNSIYTRKRTTRVDSSVGPVVVPKTNIFALTGRVKFLAEGAEGSAVWIHDFAKWNLNNWVIDANAQKDCLILR